MVFIGYLQKIRLQAFGQSQPTSEFGKGVSAIRRRLQVAVGIGYEDDIEMAKAEILQALDKADSVSKKATPSVIATGFGDSTIDLMVRWFIEDGTQANKVASTHQVIVKIKVSLDTAGVNMPFPVRTIDLSDPSVDTIVNKINQQSTTNMDKKLEK